MREEAKKLEEFKEKQKEAKKKVSRVISDVMHWGDHGISSTHTVYSWWLHMMMSFQLEQHMEALHKHKSSQYKKTVDVSKHLNMFESHSELIITGSTWSKLLQGRMTLPISKVSEN